MSKFTKIQVHVLVNRVFFLVFSPSNFDTPLFHMQILPFKISGRLRFESCLGGRIFCEFFLSHFLSLLSFLREAREVPKNLVGVNWDRRVGKPDFPNTIGNSRGNYGDPSKQRSFEEKLISPPKISLHQNLEQIFSRFSIFGTRS